VLLQNVSRLQPDGGLCGFWGITYYSCAAKLQRPSVDRRRLLRSQENLDAESCSRRIQG
jgi:hypothetical protein